MRHLADCALMNLGLKLGYGGSRGRRRRRRRRWRRRRRRRRRRHQKRLSPVEMLLEIFALKQNVGSKYDNTFEIMPPKTKMLIFLIESLEL